MSPCFLLNVMEIVLYVCHFCYPVFFIYFFLAFDFVGSARSFGFFIPATTANDLRIRRISIPDFIHYIYFPILILKKEPVFPF